MTWLIAVGGFTHIVAGSMEAYLLILAGDWMWWQMVSQFMAPVLIGNIDRRHSVIRADRLCPGDGRDLAASAKASLNLKKCR